MSRGREIGKLVGKINRALKATHPGFKRSVALKHEDGTTLVFINAFAIKYDGWVMVFSEHNGTYYNSLEEVVVSQCEEFDPEEFTSIEDLLAQDKGL